MCTGKKKKKEQKKPDNDNWNWWQEPTLNRETLNGRYRLNQDSLSSPLLTSMGTSALKIPLSERNQSNKKTKLVNQPVDKDIPRKPRATPVRKPRKVEPPTRKPRDKRPSLGKLRIH